jgi:hypothetical protein
LVSSFVLEVNTVQEANSIWIGSHLLLDRSHLHHLPKSLLNRQQFHLLRLLGVKFARERQCEVRRKRNRHKAKNLSFLRDLPLLHGQHGNVGD